MHTHTRMHASPLNVVRSERPSFETPHGRAFRRLFLHSLVLGSIPVVLVAALLYAVLTRYGLPRSVAITAVSPLIAFLCKLFFAVPSDIGESREKFAFALGTAVAVLNAYVGLHDGNLLSLRALPFRILLFLVPLAWSEVRSALRDRDPLPLLVFGLACGFPDIASVISIFPGMFFLNPAPCKIARAVLKPRQIWRNPNMR